MIALLIAAGDQSGWADWRSAITPATWGHDIDVPDWKFHSIDRWSPGNSVGGVLGGHAANIPIPGAVISGCTHQRYTKNQYSLRWQIWFWFTLSMSQILQQNCILKHTTWCNKLYKLKSRWLYLENIRWLWARSSWREICNRGCCSLSDNSFAWSNFHNWHSSLLPKGI